MSRLGIPTVDTAPEASKPLFAAVKKQHGVIEIVVNVAQTDIAFPEVSTRLAA